MADAPTQPGLEARSGYPEAEMPPEHMEEIKEVLLQPDIAIGSVHTNTRARVEATPAPAVYPHSPSIAPVAK